MSLKQSVHRVIVGVGEEMFLRHLTAGTIGNDNKRSGATTSDTRVHVAFSAIDPKLVDGQLIQEQDRMAAISAVDAVTAPEAGDQLLDDDSSPTVRYIVQSVGQKRVSGIPVKYEARVRGGVV